MCVCTFSYTGIVGTSPYRWSRAAGTVAFLNFLFAAEFAYRKSVKSDKANVCLCVDG